MAAAWEDDGVLDSPVEFVGPFQRHEVVVNGWQVPYLAATPMPGGKIDLELDNRFCIQVTVEEADRVIPFLADCMAVAMGYTCHPQRNWTTPMQRTPFVRMVPLGGVAED